MFVNVYGPPFMVGLNGNKGLRWSLLCTFAVVVLGLLGSGSEVDDFLELAPISENLRFSLVVVLMLQLVNAWSCDEFWARVLGREASIRPLVN